MSVFYETQLLKRGKDYIEIRRLGPGDFEGRSKVARWLWRYKYVVGVAA